MKRNMDRFLCFVLPALFAVGGYAQTAGHTNIVTPEGAIVNGRTAPYERSSKTIVGSPLPGKEGAGTSRPLLSHVPGYRVVFPVSNPPPPFAEVPGQYWIRTNGMAGFSSNGVVYRVLIVETNYGPKVGPLANMARATEAEAEANRERWKAEDAKAGINQEIRALENKLKASAKALRRGMTPYEVIQIMGTPHVLTARTVEGLNQYGEQAIEVKDLAGREAGCYLAYTPYPSFSRSRRNWGPYQSLEMTFDAEGKLWDFAWRN